MARAEMAKVQEEYLTDLETSIGRVLQGLHDPRAFFTHSRGSLRHFRDELCSPAESAAERVSQVLERRPRGTPARSQSVDRARRQKAQV